MGNNLRAARLAAEVGVPTAVVNAMDAKLRRENRSQYLGRFNYDSPQFHQLVRRAMDTNGDNRITRYEYIRFLIALQSNDQDCVLGELFRVFDGDNNGYIDISEVRKLFEALDQMKARTYNQQRADTFFRKVDTNHDNRLSREMFVHHATTDPIIMHDLEELRTTILRPNGH